MKTAQWRLWISRIAWGVIVFDLLLILILPADTNFGNLILLLAYTAWLILSWLLASIWLMFRHRKIFRTWWGWLATILGLIISNVLAQDVLFTCGTNLHLLFSLLSIFSGFYVGIATVILLYYHDVGLRLIAFGSAGLIWTFLLGWRFRGNLLELFFNMLAAFGEPASLWWFDSLWCITGWIIPLGFIGFIVHTLRLLIKEFLVR